MPPDDDGADARDVDPQRRGDMPHRRGKPGFRHVVGWPGTVRRLVADAGPGGRDAAPARQHDSGLHAVRVRPRTADLADVARRWRGDAGVVGPAGLALRAHRRADRIDPRRGARRPAGQLPRVVERDGRDAVPGRVGAARLGRAVHHRLDRMPDHRPLHSAREPLAAGGDRRAGGLSSTRG